MGFFTDNKELGNIAYNRLIEDRQIISQKWNKYGLLEGLEGSVKENMATLFENQLNYVTRLKESTNSGSSGAFETVAFPIVRRVFSKLLANDIVSVQALNLPIGKLFYFNPKISTRKNDTDFAGEKRHDHPDGAYSNAARDKDLGNPQVTFETKSLYDAYYATLYNDYGDALFDRTKGRMKPVSGAVTIVNGAVGTDKVIRVKVTGFSTTDQGKLIGVAGVPMDTESFLASLRIFPTATLTTAAGFEEYQITTAQTVPFSLVVQKYGQAIVNQLGELLLDLDVSYPEAVYVPFSGTTAFNYVYNTYSSLEHDSEMAEVTFTLDEITVAVESRKMRAQWTPELAQDVQQFHNIDAEAELTALLSEQIAAEIDREILRDLRNAAPWTTRWDYNGLKKQSGTFFGTQKDWNQTLLTKINQISAQIYKATMRGGANWIVVSPEASAVFDDLEYFHVSNAAPDQDQYNMGIEKVGSLGGRYTVYRDPFMPVNTVLIGRKGSTILETGYIYAPYVPLELTGVITDPTSFVSIRGIMTRYAKKIVNNRFYGKITIDGLASFGIGDLM